jgi:hypothetical protein
LETEVEVSNFQQQLRNLEREIVQLAQSGCDFDSYFRQFLDKAVTVLGEGGAIWIRTESGELGVLSHINLVAAGMEQEGPQSDLMFNAIQKVLQSGAPTAFPARAAAGELGVNNSDHALLFVPVIAARQVAAVMVLIAPQDMDPQALQRFLSFVVKLCQHAGEFIQHQHLGDLQEQLTRTDRFRQYVSALHSSLDPKRSCYALANYAQELLGSFRCMAGVYHINGKFQMEAISGLESVAVKSSFIRSISKIARQVCRNDKVLIVENPSAAMLESTEPTEDLVTEARIYMLQAKSLVLGIFPIRSDDRVVGALIIEKSNEQPIDEPQRRRIDNLISEAGSALANSLTWRDVPFSPLVRAVARVRDKIYAMGMTRRLVWGVVWALVLLTPLIATRPVKVVGHAELVPMEARIAFANQDGIIDETYVTAGQQVQAGDLLALLDTKFIDSQLDHVRAEIVQAGLDWQIAPNSNKKIFKSREDLANYKLKMLLREREQYRITAPIDGTLVTRDSAIRQLPAKPVSRGEEVFEIVPGQTPWNISVNIPESEVGEFLKAFDALSEGEYIPARVILHAYPNTTLQTHVLSVSPRAYVLEAGPEKYENVIEVLVEQPEEFDKIVLDPRPGLEGKVAFECGRRNLFYVFSHKFINFVRVKMF